jgi:hypothetical protein
MNKSTCGGGGGDRNYNFINSSPIRSSLSPNHMYQND